MVIARFDEIVDLPSLGTELVISIVFGRGPSYGIKKIDDRTLGLTGKKDGKVVTTGRIAVSVDGKTRTVNVSATDSAGKKVKSTAVYDKQ